MIMWNQKYKVTFKIDKDVEISVVIEMINEEEYRYDDILMAAKNKIQKQTGLVFTELSSNFVTLVLIDSPENKTYLAAKWLYDDGRTPDYYDWNDYRDAISGSGVSEDKVEFEGLKDCLEMIFEIEN